MPSREALTVSDVGKPSRSLVFLSYRREDSGGYAGRLYDSLSSRVPRDRLFMDVDAIPPGVDFEDHIDGAMSRSAVCLVLIGPRWLAAAGGSGRRIDLPDDYVRREIESALRQSLLLIPVLLPGAIMPALGDLPDSIREFGRRNAIELSDSRWSYDVERLLTVIGSRLGAARRPTRLSALGGLRNAMWIRAALIGAGLLGVAVLAWSGGLWPDGRSQAPSVSPGAGSALGSTPVAATSSAASATSSLRPATPRSLSPGASASASTRQSAVPIVVPSIDPAATTQPEWPVLGTGRYRFTYFRPDMSFEVRDGWTARRDYIDAGEISHDQSPLGYISFARVQVALTSPCFGGDTQVLGPLASDLMAWLTRHELLDAEQVYPINIARFTGLRVDVTVPTDVAIDCPQEPPASRRVRLFLSGQDTFFLLPGETARLIALDTLDGRLVIGIGAEGGDLEAILALTDAVLQSIQFEGV